MAFKMSPIGKRKCPYSPLQKRGLINPSPVMNNGDDKNAKKTSSSVTTTETGYVPKGEQLKKEQEALNKEAQERQENLSKTFKGEKRMTWTEYWEKNKEALMKKHGSKEAYFKWAKEWSKNNPNEITITAGFTKNEKPKRELDRKAKVEKLGLYEFLRGQNIKLPFKLDKQVPKDIPQYPGGPVYEAYVNEPLSEKELKDALARMGDEGNTIYAQYTERSRKNPGDGTYNEYSNQGDQQAIDTYIESDLSNQAAGLNNQLTGGDDREVKVKSGG